MDGERNSEDVEAKLELAKLSRKELAGLSQTIYFDPEDNSDLILIEMDAHLMDEAPRKLVIRGDADDDLVICTGEFALKCVFWDIIPSSFRFHPVWFSANALTVKWP